jgi:hypothetical protein
MKKLVSLLFLFLLFFGGTSCKDKDKPAPAPQPAPVQYGKINFKVITYDGEGKVEADNSGVKISLVEDNKSAMTDAAGLASFDNLPYGTHTPVLQKQGYDGPLLTVALNSAEQQVTLPFPKHSDYVARNFQANAQGPGQVYVTFTLTTMPNDSVRIAVLGSPSPDLSERNFVAGEIFKVKDIKITDREISSLPSFNKMISALDSGATFYVTVMPVSYGMFQGNLQPGPQVLGENLDYVGNLPLKKKWKN